MVQKKYMDIERLKPAFVDGFEIGDSIVVQEKIDGANFSIRYDNENNCIKAFSRKKELDFNNTLRGAWNWSQSLDVEKVKNVLGNNLILFAEWLCLSGDTVIRKTSGGKNTNYMMLREMYKYKNEPRPDRIHHRLDRGKPFVIKNIIDNPNITENELFRLHNTNYYANFKRILNELLKTNYIECHDSMYRVTDEGIKWYNHYVRGDSWWDINGFPSLFSLDFKTDKIVSNKMIDVIYTGDKEVYKITTRKGYSIKATLEHPFLTPKGFVSLKNLKEFDCVAVTNMLCQRGHRRLGEGSKRILNLMKEYKNKIGKCEECGNTTCLELHHKDGDYTNNNTSNYQVLCSDCHKKVHSNDAKFREFKYEYEFDYITSIEYIGVEDCYDIAMDGDETTANFIANGFIVHNCKHTVPYPTDKYNHAYCYDVFDVNEGKYLMQDKVESIVKALDLTYVPVFYVGEFISWEHIKEFVGKTEMGGEYGEGVVVKNQTKLNNPNTRLPFYTKIVCDTFCETKGHRESKPVDMEKMAERERLQSITETIVTNARVQKLVNKMVDDGILREDWDAHDMSIIAKNIGKEIYYDCVKEEPEIVNQVGELFGKLASSTAMKLVREILRGRENV